MNTSVMRSNNVMRLRPAADWAALLVVVSLPWSVSATSILIGIWLVLLVPTLSLRDLKDAVSSPAGWLPVLLVAFGALGMFWADVSFAERWHGFDSFPRLLVIPLLFAQFRGTPQIMRVWWGFLLSCGLLLLISFVSINIDSKQLDGFMRMPGVPVKDYIAQGGEFMFCAVVLLYLAIDGMRSRRYGVALAALALAGAFLFNIFYVVTSRTAIVTLPLLLLLLGFRQFGWKGLVGAIVAGSILGGLVWSSSPYLRFRIGGIAAEITQYHAENTDNSAGERIEFLTKSFNFVRQAPVFGHGTGSIDELFRRAARGDKGAAAVAAQNPHNQTFAVAIQLGLVGAALLWAMWISHLLLFRQAGLVSWIGLVVVVQNVVSSLFNSHLFDFTQGWFYVFGVGLTGAAVLHLPEKERLAVKSAAPAASAG